MRTRKLGRTGLEVSELALGGLFVASFLAEAAVARRTVSRSLELGVNYIDTAPGYGNSEEVLGTALQGDTRPVILSTKLGGRPKPFLAQDRDALLASVEESLRLLKRKVIDILMIHEPDRPGQYDWWTDRERCQGPVMEVIDELKRRGTVRWSGLGGTTAYEMAPLIRSGKFDVVLTAFNYSLLWREAQIEVIPAAKAMGMGIIVGSPLQQGALARRYDAEIERGAPWLNRPRREQLRRLYAYLDEIGLPIDEVALRFVISNPDISCTLMGARSPEEAERNVASVEKGPLPERILEGLDEIASMVPFRPFEEPFGLGWLLGGRPYKGPGAAR